MEISKSADLGKGALQWGHWVQTYCKTWMVINLHLHKYIYILCIHNITIRIICIYRPSHVYAEGTAWTRCFACQMVKMRNWIQRQHLCFAAAWRRLFRWYIPLAFARSLEPWYVEPLLDVGLFTDGVGVVDWNLRFRFRQLRVKDVLSLMPQSSVFSVLRSISYSLRHRQTSHDWSAWYSLHRWLWHSGTVS